MGIPIEGFVFELLLLLLLVPTACQNGKCKETNFSREMNMKELGSAIYARAIQET